MQMVGGQGRSCTRREVETGHVLTRSQQLEGIALECGLAGRGWGFCYFQQPGGKRREREREGEGERTEYVMSLTWY